MTSVASCFCGTHTQNHKVLDVGVLVCLPEQERMEPTWTAVNDVETMDGEQLGR